VATNKQLFAISFASVSDTTRWPVQSAPFVDGLHKCQASGAQDLSTTADGVCLLNGATRDAAITSSGAGDAGRLVECDEAVTSFLLADKALWVQ